MEISCATVEVGDSGFISEAENARETLSPEHAMDLSSRRQKDDGENRRILTSLLTAPAQSPPATAPGFYVERDMGQSGGFGSGYLDMNNNTVGASNLHSVVNNQGSFDEVWTNKQQDPAVPESANKEAIPGSESTSLAEPPKRKIRRARNKYSTAMVSQCEKVFESTHYPDRDLVITIAKLNDMEPKQVRTWFSNKRSRVKRALEKKLAGPSKQTDYNQESPRASQLQAAYPQPLPSHGQYPSPQITPVSIQPFKQFCVPSAQAAYGYPHQPQEHQAGMWQYNAPATMSSPSAGVPATFHPQTQPASCPGRPVFRWTYDPTVKGYQVVFAKPEDSISSVDRNLASPPSDDKPLRIERVGSLEEWDPVATSTPTRKGGDYFNFFVGPTGM